MPRIGGKMYLAQQSQWKGLGFGAQMNRRDYERSQSTAASYSQSVFDTGVTLSQNLAELVLENTVDRLNEEAKAKTANALTVDTSSFTSNSPSIDLEV